MASAEPSIGESSLPMKTLPTILPPPPVYDATSEPPPYPASTRSLPLDHPNLAPEAPSQNNISHEPRRFSINWHLISCLIFTGVIVIGTATVLGLLNNGRFHSN
ncbi:hypothetical protein N431DRAFT_426817 [Stipitochalara longipes BDJ]|nr:hypothetical protein N431DRAFT_426817 [Stipitochalara longipes BDJ]